MEIGKTITLTASLRDASAGDSATSTQSSTDSTPLRWGLDNTSLASVRAGKVLGLKEGTVRIVALSGNSYGFSTVVVVRAAVAEVTEPTSPPVVSAGSVGSLYSGYQATSPHWSHIRTLATDFYYHWDATQRAWAGAHFDAALSGSGSAWRSANAGVKHLPYTLLWTVLTPATGARGNITSVYYDDMRSWYASHPGYRLEDAFLHGSSEKSPSTRLGVKIWDSERWMITACTLSFAPTIFSTDMFFSWRICVTM